MYCECGVRLSAKARFCSQCGKKIADPELSWEEETNSKNIKANAMPNLPFLMTPREFAKYVKVSDNVIRDKCKNGQYPHERRRGENGRISYLVLVRETLEIIRRECIANAPFAPSPAPKPKNGTSKVTKVMHDIVKR